MLQKRFRSHRSRRLLLDAVRNRFSKQFDPDSGAAFYIDSKTKKATWTKPAILRDGEDLEMTPEEEDAAAAEAAAAAAYADAAGGYEWGQIGGEEAEYYE